MSIEEKVKVIKKQGGGGKGRKGKNKRKRN